MARIDRPASGFRSVSVSDSNPGTPAASSSGASPEDAGAKPPVSFASATLCGSSDSVVTSASAGTSSVGAPNGRESDSSSFAGSCSTRAVVSAATAGGCHGAPDAGAGGGGTGAAVTGGATGPPVGGAGGVQPVGGAGSIFCWTIFSRFSSTLKLNRRRLGFPRRPPSWAGGSPLAGSTAGGLPKTGTPPGMFGPGWATGGAGMAGPLEAEGYEGCPNGGGGPYRPG